MSIIQTSMARHATLGEFEHLVLLAVLRHADGVMGSRIGRELEARAKRRVSRGALYATLDRLQQKGFLTWVLEPTGPDRGGHPRRVFAITRAGRAAVRQYGRAVRSLSAGIEDLL
jgi:PadR family transcriptional regulator, regulatory protein PadR